MRQRAIRSMIGLIYSVLIMGLYFSVQDFAVQGFAAAPTQPQADRIIILKSAHTMTLLSGDKVLKTYKVALGLQCRRGQSAWKATTKRLKAITRLTPKIRRASFICLCISPIPARQTGKVQLSWVRGPAGPS
jgi:hypothetical protein